MKQKGNLNQHQSDPVSGFTRINNTVFTDGDLSLKAKGLLCCLFSLPPGWYLTETGLIHMFPEGRKAISSAIKELESKGYLRKTRLLSSETDVHKIQYQYDIYDTRQGTATKCAARNQRAQKVSAEKVEGINTNKEIININNNLSINQNQGDNTYQEEFGRLWAEYPCQEGMVPAFNAYIEARETGTSYDEIEEGLQLFVQQIKDNHIKHCYAMSGQKWFEGKHWTDDMPSTKSNK